MRLIRRSPTTFVVLSTALAVSLFSTTTFADDGGVPNLSTIANQPPAAIPGKGTAVITNIGNVALAVAQNVPTITGGPGPNADDGSRPTSGLPKLPGAFSYPPASVPPTQNAPYMQTSNLPEGTVFIAVGAFLGFLAMAVLLWRGLIAWSLHRSVKRAAMQQDMADTKALFRTPIAPTFKYPDRESTVSLSNFGGAGKNSRRGRPSTVGLVPVATQGLFFSPTAGAAGAGGLSHPSNRGSNHLPAGYYAASASAPGNGAGLTHIAHGSRDSISLSNLRPSSQGYSRARGVEPSPPVSPASLFPPQFGHRLNPSTSSLDLNPRATALRAPSAYLDDLFDEAGAAPGQLQHGARF